MPNFRNRRSRLQPLSLYLHTQHNKDNRPETRTKTKRNEQNLKLMNNLKLKQTMNELTANLQLTQHGTTQTRCYRPARWRP
jgi:hypothetical protein